jgi:hypothetical protein
LDSHMYPPFPNTSKSLHEEGGSSKPEFHLKVLAPYRKYREVYFLIHP